MSRGGFLRITAMRAYLYCFGYENPLQFRNNDHYGWDDEDSQAVLIDAESEEAALRWGQEISERFIKLLFRDEGISWKQLGYANWVELPGKEVPGTPHVRDGEFPDFNMWL
jgi:hypothetical protein